MSATTVGTPNEDKRSVAAEGKLYDTQQPGPAKGGDGKAPEKTISCVSCRKRKLKCDRTKPQCSTCIRLRHECEYPERRRNPGSKRRNMKELEARLAQVETQLVGEKLAATQSSPADLGIEGDWDGVGVDMEMNLDIDSAHLLDQSYNISHYNTKHIGDTSMPSGDFFSQELLGLGLQEPLPPQDMIDELYAIYFERFHPTMPMMHRLRYYASLDRAPNMRPPVCLQYAMWTIAASLSENYTGIEDILYQRARRYIDAEEMKGFGHAFVTVYHVQTWVLIGCYEAKKTFFSRSWMSAGRTIRLANMLGLYRIDGEAPGVKTILPPAKDWIELEERRRTFWVAFYVDRWSSSGTGWPMMIDEKEIKTNLPASEYAFENGVEEQTMSLAEALTPQDGTSRISPFGGVLVAATLFGHNFYHLHPTGSDENPDDLQNGEFWKRHRKMDNVLSNTFMFLPDQLRLPAGLRDINVVFLHLNIHTSAICLHQAAVSTAKKYKFDSNFIRQSEVRCLMAADEITNVMKLSCHMDPANMHSWVGFCLYIAASTYVKNQASGEQFYPQAVPNLEFLLTAMRAVGRKHLITTRFVAQLEFEIESGGIYRNSRRSAPQTAEVLNLPDDDGLPIDRQGIPINFDDIEGYAKTASPSRYGGSTDGHGISTLTPASDILLNESRSPSSYESPSTTWESPRNPIQIPENYYSKSMPEPVLSEPQSRKSGFEIPPVHWVVPDVNSFVEGVDSGFAQINSQAKIQSFVQGLNPVASREPPKTSDDAHRHADNKSPSNHNNTMRFPYRIATPALEPRTIGGAHCSWANMDPSNIPVSSAPDFPQFANFDQNGLSEVTGFINFISDPAWIPDESEL